MDIHDAIELLVKFKDGDVDILQHLEANVRAVCGMSDIVIEEIWQLKHVENLTGVFQCENTNSIIWKYICLSFHYLITFVEAQKDDNELKNLVSIGQGKNIRTLIELIVMLGVVPNLVPGVGIPLNARSRFASQIPSENLSTMDKYVRLRACTRGLLICKRHPELRKHIISRHLNDLLAALIQIIQAPLKAPNDATEDKGASTSFQMTRELWDKFSNDKLLFDEDLKAMLTTVYQPALMKELMVLMNSCGPNLNKWMTKFIVQTLCAELMKPNGLLSLTRAMFEMDDMDTGSNWHQLLVLQKLIFDLEDHVSENYFQNICGQLLEMLTELPLDMDNMIDLKLIIPRLILKKLIVDKPLVYQMEILNVIIKPLIDCAEANAANHSNVVVGEEQMMICFKNLYQLFVVDITHYLQLPCQNDLLKYTSILYHCHSKIYSSFKASPIVRALMARIISDGNSTTMIRTVLYSILYNKTVPDIQKFSNTLMICKGINKGIFIRGSAGRKIIYATNDGGNGILDIISACSTQIQATIFGIVFKNYSTFYLTRDAGTRHSELLRLQDEPTTSGLTGPMDTQAISLKILGLLCVRPEIMRKVDVNVLLEFLQNVIDNYQNSRNENYEDSECLFQSLVLLDVVLCNSATNRTLVGLISSLRNIENETKDTELRALIKKICKKITNDEDLLNPLTEFDMALEEVVDPLLPVRAHGLRWLTKLIESGHPQANFRRQYLMCLFKENLRNTDSYIYLSAINGLTALATMHPETVIRLLTEEFLLVQPWSTGIDQQARLTLGETLVKVTRNLGEMASMYKDILLNTFLTAIRDPDDLIRVSSFSNIGEVCEILGYKIGNITLEILSSVEYAVTNDPSVEVKRASVLVVHKLLIGLGPDTIVCLKESLLPIYKRLKDIYEYGDDEIMILHAQLALEELNKATRNFLQPPRPLEKQLNIFGIKPID